VSDPGAVDYARLHDDLDAGRLHRVIDGTQPYLASHAGDSELWAIRGIALLRSGKLIDAEEALRRAASLPEPDGYVLTHFGSCLLALQRNAEASTVLQRAVQSDPDADDTRMLLATACVRVREVPRAVQEARAALGQFMKAPRLLPAPKQADNFDSRENNALLWETLALLARAGVHAFAIAGVLLGLVREGTLLPFDKDFDLGVPSNELGTAISTLLDNGWQLAGGDHLVNPVGLTHSGTRVALDICAFQKNHETGGLMSGFWLRDAPWEWNRVTLYPDMPLVEDQSPAGPIWRLKHPETYLDALYGDWRTPDADFDSVAAGRNISCYSPLVQYFALERIYRHWKAGRFSKALALARHGAGQLPDDPLMRDAVEHLTARMQQADPAPETRTRPRP
jgi:tetratricopeptide (TPR) repeat protein